MNHSYQLLIISYELCATILRALGTQFWSSDGNVNTNPNSLSPPLTLALPLFEFGFRTWQL